MVNVWLLMPQSLVGCVAWCSLGAVSLTWFSLVAERHWPQAVPGRWEPGGGEVCSHPDNVDVPGGVCGGRVRLRRDQVPGWRLSARLHSGWQSRTRKVCIRGKCAPGDSLAAVVTSDRLLMPLSSARPRKCAQSFWGCFRFSSSRRPASMVNEMSPVDKLVSLMTKVCILLELFWFDLIVQASIRRQEVLTVGCSLGGGGKGSLQTTVLWKLGIELLEESLCLLFSWATFSRKEILKLHQLFQVHVIFTKFLLSSLTGCC